MRADSSYVQLSLLSVIALHAMLQKEGAHTNSWILSFERRRLCTSLGSVLCLIINLLLAAFQCSSCCIKYWLHAVFSGGNQTKICAPPHFTWLSCPPQDALTATAATILSLHYLSCQATMQCNGFVHLCFCDQMHLVFSHYVINMQIIKKTRSSLFSHYWRYWQL